MPPFLFYVCITTNCFVCFGYGRSSWFALANCYLLMPLVMNRFGALKLVGHGTNWAPRILIYFVKPKSYYKPPDCCSHRPHCCFLQCVLLHLAAHRPGLLYLGVGTKSRRRKRFIKNNRPKEQLYIWPKKYCTTGPTRYNCTTGPRNKQFKEQLYNQGRNRVVQGTIVQLAQGTIVQPG